MFVSVLLSVVLTFAFVFAVAYSATTISTNISTGNLTVTGTADVTGVTTMSNASTTQALTVAGMTYLDGGLKMDTTLFTVADGTGDTTIGGTLGVTGVTTMVNASTTQALTVAGMTYLNGGVQSIRSSSTLQATGDIWSYAKLGAGTSSPWGEISATSSATTTLYLSSDTTNKGGCIQIKGVDNNIYRMYATGTKCAFWEAGPCK